MQLSAEKLYEFYVRHDPSKTVGEVASILRTYEGNEEGLVEGLKKKYGSSINMNPHDNKQASTHMPLEESLPEESVDRCELAASAGLPEPVPAAELETELARRRRRRKKKKNQKKNMKRKKNT